MQREILLEEEKTSLQELWQCKCVCTTYKNLRSWHVEYAWIECWEFNKGSVCMCDNMLTSVYIWLQDYNRKKGPLLCVWCSISNQEVKLNFSFDSFVVLHLQVVCARCSPNSLPLPQFGINKAVRVCSNCYIKHLGHISSLVITPHSLQVQ